MTKLIFLILCTSTFIGGCAEKKTRIWIAPPYGAETADQTKQKIYYQIEDIHTGKKENLIIPLNQVPENLVVKSSHLPQQSEGDHAEATQADRMINEGKLPETSPKGSPSISYLRGMTEVEGLYQKAQFTEALVRLAPLIEQYPKQARLFLMQGTLYRKIGEKRLALDSYKRARSLEKNNPAIEEAILKTQDEIGESL